MPEPDWKAEAVAELWKSIQVCPSGRERWLIEAFAQTCYERGQRPVRKRVRSSLGHLSNDAACEFIREFMAPETKHVIAAHLSHENNSFDLVRLVAEKAIRERGLEAEVLVASQEDGARRIVL
jgi:hypothetical protein